jgi:acyl-CoA synthetase (AMP-forming)/AMP-acid ligase II
VAPVFARPLGCGPRLPVCGGAALPAATQRALAARLPGATVGQAFGLTETTVGVSMPDRDAGGVPVTVGRVMPTPSCGWSTRRPAVTSGLAERVAPHKRLRAVRFAEAIPRTPSGRLLRRALAVQAA